MEAAPLLVLSGPPGAGKTTVAGLLVQRRAPAVHLRGDDFWHVIAGGPVPPYLPEAHTQNEVVVTAVAAAAAAYAAGGYFTVLDTIVVPWFLERVRAEADRRHVAMAYVVLRPSLQVVLARARRDLLDSDPLRAMHAAFADLGPHEAAVIDSSSQSPEETAEAVWARLGW